MPRAAGGVLTPSCPRPHLMCLPVVERFSGASPLLLPHRWQEPAQLAGGRLPQYRGRLGAWPAHMPARRARSCRVGARHFLVQRWARRRRARCLLGRPPCAWLSIAKWALGWPTTEQCQVPCTLQTVQHMNMLCGSARGGGTSRSCWSRWACVSQQACCPAADHMAVLAEAPQADSFKGMRTTGCRRLPNSAPACAAWADRSMCRWAGVGIRISGWLKDASLRAVAPQLLALFPADGDHFARP